MTVAMKLITPGDPSDLFCDTCSNRFADRGGQERTDEYARAAGWHIYRGPSFVDSAVILVKALCPECVGTPNSRGPKPETMEGQLDLGIEVPVVPKGKRRKDGIN